MKALKEETENLLEEKIGEVLNGWDFSEDIATALTEGDEIKNEVEKQLDSAIANHDIVSSLDNRVAELEDLVKKQDLRLLNLEAECRNLNDRLRTEEIEHENMMKAQQPKVTDGTEELPYHCLDID
jgi:molecular chaperone GrpE (heat shock protein)